MITLEENEASSQEDASIHLALASTTTTTLMSITSSTNPSIEDPQEGPSQIFQERQDALNHFQEPRDVLQRQLFQDPQNHLFQPPQKIPRRQSSLSSRRSSLISDKSSDKTKTPMDIDASEANAQDHSSFMSVMPYNRPSPLSKSKTLRKTFLKRTKTSRNQVILGEWTTSYFLAT